MSNLDDEIQKGSLLLKIFPTYKCKWGIAKIIKTIQERDSMHN